MNENKMSINSGNNLLSERFNKVPAVTLYFWIIKILCTTVGETAADYINTKLNLGLNGTTLIMSGLLMIALVFQFRAKKYIPSVYWIAVVLISVVGTLITDNLTDHLGISLFTTTIVFALILAIVLFVWYKFEKTLSIHEINTFRREGFYWVTILFTFALGTASGDLLAEQLKLGYWLSALIFGGMILLIYMANKYLRMDNIFSFWIAYILTRPLGASIGDYLSQSPKDGGLGLGTAITSLIFLTAISVTVIYLTKSKKDILF
jgi:uncharacterized membrane-anchored protein